jgi:hypothetical protein
LSAPKATARQHKTWWERQAGSVKAAIISAIGAVVVALVGLLSAYLSRPAATQGGPEAQSPHPSGSFSASSSPSPSVSSARPTYALHDRRSAGSPGIAFSPSGRILAAGDLNGFTDLWDTATRKVSATFRNPDGQQVFGVAFSPDGNTLSGALLSVAYEPPRVGRLQA